MYMPPKTKFSSEQIIELALEVVRENGLDALTARELAAKLGTSTRPIFTHFKTMDELTAEVVAKAKSIYKEYVLAGLEGERAFKSYGLQLLKFAKDEPELYEVVFMKQGSGPSYESVLESEGNKEEVIKVISWTFDILEEQASWMFDNLMLYAHGIASMYRIGAVDFTEEQLDSMLSEMAQTMATGLKAKDDDKYHFLNPEFRAKLQG